MDEVRGLDEGVGNLAAPASERGERRRRSHGHTSRHELWARIAALRKQRLTLALACLALAVTALVAFYTAYHARSVLNDARTMLAEERATFETRVREVETQLAAARDELSAAQASIGVLVEKRIPGLRPLQLDQAIAIGEHSVRDVTFTALQGSESQGYESKVVIENSGPAPFAPGLRVLLFDRSGVEVGRARVGLEADGKPSTLRPGEIRSYFAAVKLAPGREAAHFRVDPVSD